MRTRIRAASQGPCCCYDSKLEQRLLYRFNCDVAFQGTQVTLLQTCLPGGLTVFLVAARC